MLLALTFITSTLSAKYDNRYLMLLSGLCMCYTVISAHNFFHRRDNFRMFYFNLTFYNYKEWRISHAMYNIIFFCGHIKRKNIWFFIFRCRSHHLFPNSLHDLEVTLFEPLLCWIPMQTKTFGQRFISWLYSPIIYIFICHDQLVKRILFSFTSKTNLFQSSDLVSLTVPLVMLIFGNSNPFTVFKVWMQIIMVASFIFHLIGLNAGHHHPDNVHDVILWLNYFEKKNMIILHNFLLSFFQMDKLRLVFEFFVDFMQ